MHSSGRLRHGTNRSASLCYYLASDAHGTPSCVAWDRPYPHRPSQKVGSSEERSRAHIADAVLQGFRLEKFEAKIDMVS